MAEDLDIESLYTGGNRPRKKKKISGLWWLAGAGAVGVLLLSTRAKASPKSSKGGKGEVPLSVKIPEEVAVVFRKEPEADFVPGNVCHTGLPGVFSAYNEAGECVIFYDRARDAELLREHVLRAYEDTGSLDFCDEIYITDHKGSFLERTYLNPIIVWIAHTAITSMYGTVDPSVWPPKGEDSGDKSPYWIEITWQIVVNTILEEICGIDTSPIS